MPRTAALHSHGPLPSSPACPRRAQAPPSPTRPLSYYCGRRGLQENPPLPPAHPAIRRSASGPPVYPQRWTSGDLDPSPPSDASSVASTASAPSHAPVLDPAPASAATGGPASSNPPTPGETVVSDSTVGTTPWSTPRPLAFSPMTPHASSDPPSRARSPGRSPTGRFVHSPVGSSPTPPAAAGTSPPTPVRCPPLRPVPDQEAGAEGPGSAYESDEGSDAALYLVAPVREEIDYTFTANTTATCASSVHTDAPVAVDLPVEAEQPLREGVAAGGGFHGTAGNAPPVDPSTSSAAPTLSSSCSSTSSTATSATTSSSSASSSATSSASAASSQSVSPAVVVPEPRVSPPAAHDVVSPEPLRCEVYSTAEASPEATPHGSPRGSPASTPRQRGPQPTATEAALLAALKAELAMREVDAARWERRFDAQQQSVRDLTAELAAMRGQLAAALALRCPTCDAAVGPEPKPAASAPRARARALVSPSPDKPRRRLVSPAPDRDAAVLEPRSPAPRTPTAPSPQAALPESPAKRGFTVSCSAAVSAPGTPNPLLALLSEAEREAAGHRGAMALDAEDTRAIIDDISKVYRVMGTVGEMAADRGYNVPPNWRPGSMAEFKDEYVSPAASQILRERMTLVCSRESDADLLLVLFAGTEPINSQRVKDFIAKAVDVKATTLVVIHAGKINPAARSYYMEAPREHERLHTELFEEDDLVVNITKHELVPKHEPLTSEQAKEVLQAYSLKVSMLPRILSRDPVALYYGMKKGGIVKITRKSETAGEYTTYRQVM